MKPQIIYENERPAFVVLPYEEYMQLAADDEELIPFDVADYITNPLKAVRIDAGMTQTELADLLKVSQAYIAKIEAPSYKPTDKLMKRVSVAIS